LTRPLLTGRLAIREGKQSDESKRSNSDQRKQNARHPRDDLQPGHGIAEVVKVVKV
jgi:hypothetical protein